MESFPSPRLRMNISPRSAWPLFSDQSPAEFHAQMTAGLPPDTDLRIDLGQEGGLKKIKYSAQGLSWEMNIKDATSACHDGAFFDETHQKHGLNKIISARVFSLLQQMGIRTIQIKAGDSVGAYAHGRMGYKPNIPGWQEARQKIQLRLEYLIAHPSPIEGPLPPEYVKILKSALCDDAPKALWSIIDQESEYYGIAMGKLLTLNGEPLEDRSAFRAPQILNPGSAPYPDIEWDGLFDFNDQNCMSRFCAYIKPIYKKADPALNDLCPCAVIPGPRP